MVTIIGPVFETTATEGLSNEQREQLQAAVQQMVLVLAPLTSVASRDDVDTVLRVSANAYTQAKVRVVDRWLGSLPHPEAVKHFREEVAAGNDEVVARKIDVLGAELAEQFFATLSGIRGLMRWISDTFIVEETDMSRPLPSSEIVGPKVIYVDMLANAVGGVLTDRYTDWEPSAIPVLVQACDDLLTEVEDLVLSQTAQASSPEDTVPYTLFYRL